MTELDRPKWPSGQLKFFRNIPGAKFELFINVAALAEAEGRVKSQ